MVRDVARHPTIHRTAPPPNKELSDPNAGLSPRGQTFPSQENLHKRGLNLHVPGGDRRGEVIGGRVDLVQ